jgi:hypothetical protein
MTLVRLVKDWEGLDPDRESLDMFQQTPGNDGIWGDVKFTFEEVSECDYLVMFNRCREDLKFFCPEGNAWIKADETPNVAFRWQKRSYKYFDRIYGFNSWQKVVYKDYHVKHCTAQWQIKKTYVYLKDLEVDSNNKIDTASFITSSKHWMEGHKLRLELLSLLKDEKSNIDVFGRGINPVHDKFDALYPYKYSIAIENNFFKDYWTDKIIDCFLTWTMPIYCGAPNIFEYFPKDSMITINPKRPEKIWQKLERAIEDNLWEKNLEAIKTSRELILDKYQFFPFMSNEIKKDLQRNLKKPTKEYNIPSNIAPWESGGQEQLSLSRKIEWQVRRFLDIRPY